MTVSTTTSVVSYLGNGATTVFTFPFIGVSGSDLEVLVTSSIGVVTTLSEFQYTLVINTPPVGGLWGIGGSVTYPITGTPLQVGSSITINRIVPFEQLISISNQGAFYPQSVEQGLDLIEMQLQQIETGNSFAFSAPISDVTPPNTLPPAAARANGIFGFDSSGEPIVLTNTGGTTPGTSATPRVVSTSGTATVGLALSDSFAGISIYQASGSVTTVQLPSSGGPYPIYDGNLNAGSYPITILPPVGKTILGQTQYKLAFNGQSAEFSIDSIQVLVE